MAALVRPWSPVDPRVIELVPNVGARWYVVEIASRIAERKLVERGFGIFVPECEDIAIVRRYEIVRRTPMIGGYVFVFVWNSAENLRKLYSTEGVVSVLGVLPDDKIDQLRATENGKRLDYVEREVGSRRVLGQVKSAEEKRDVRPARRKRRKPRRAFHGLHEAQDP